MTSPFRGISNWLSGMSIRKRLTIYLLLGLIPIVLTSALFFREVYESRKQQVLLGHMATALATAGAVREFIDGIVQAQEIMSVVMGNQKMTTVQMTTFFQQARHDVPIMETVAFALPNGTVVAAVPQRLVGIKISDRKYFREIAGGRDWAVSDLLVSRPSGNPSFDIAQRVERNGQFAGVLFSTISPSALRSFVATTAAPGIGYGILDSTGRVIVTTILPENLLPANRDRSWVPGVSQALHGKPAFAEPFLDRADGVWRMGASVPVPEVGWVVNVLQPVSDAMAPVRRAAALDILADLLIITILAFLAWVLGTSLARPIVSLARKADAVAHGDFSQRMESGDRSELGVLAEAFNNMTIELDRSRAQARRAREQAVFLADIGELLVSTLEADVMLQTVAKRTVEFLGDIVVIFTLDPSGMLVPVAIHAFESPKSDLARQLMSERPIKVGFGVVGTAVEHDETVFAPRISDLEDPDMRYYLEKAGVISSIAVPMKVHGQVVGALSVSTVREPMDRDCVPIVQEIARRLGLALESIHLYEDALERERFQKGLAELAASVSSSLDPAVVMSEICGKSIQLLDADGIYIWVLDEDKSILTGTSACGFNADEFIGMVMPMSERNAGAVQAVARKQGFYLHEMPEWRDVAPLLTKKFNAQSTMFVPLISVGEVLGVMVVTDTQDPDRFDDQSLARANLIAGYAAAGLSNAGSYQRERRIAETLQRGLLPEVPSTVRNFELANFYTPAWSEAAIGGDFYDFIELGDDLYGLAIGDVSGKGLEAAVVTAMVKYVLRAYTAEDPEPVVVLERANNAIVKYTEAEMFITLVYGLLDSSARRFRYGSAGHEPILLYRAADRTVSFENPTGTAAGLIPNEEYLTNEVTLAPGDLLIMYTDGLSDARSPSGGFLGQEGLAKFVIELADRPAHEFLRALMRQVRVYTGGEFADDIAVLVVRAIPV